MTHALLVAVVLAQQPLLLNPTGQTNFELEINSSIPIAHFSGSGDSTINSVLIHQPNEPTATRYRISCAGPATESDTIAFAADNLVDHAPGSELYIDASTTLWECNGGQCHQLWKDVLGVERSPSVELNGDGFIAWTKNGILFRTGNQLQFIAFPYPIVFASPNLARTAAVVVMNWQDIALTQVVSVPSGAVLEQEFLGSIYEVGRVRLSPDANLVAVERTSQSPRAVYIWNRSMKE